MVENLAIGVFDSGLGGLSVLRELSRELPSEHFIYLGDIARLPYGTKSKRVVSHYVRRCLEFLLKKRVKLIVIACNTATALALSEVQREFSTEILGVIEPGVEAGLAATRSGKILVVATESTVKTEAYVQRFSQRRPDIEVRQKACPLLVPLAEEGWFDHPVTEEVIKAYLRPFSSWQYDTLLLGCTHYPLLEKSFERVVGPKVSLIHGGRTLAQQVRERLTAQNRLTPLNHAGSVDFYSTDYPAATLPMVTSLFGNKASFELIDL